MITNGNQIKNRIGSTVTLRGRVYRIRKMSGFAFLVLQLPRGLVQCTLAPDDLPPEQSCVELSGEVAADPRSRSGCEIRVRSIRILSEPEEISPVVINHKELDMSLETLLNFRPLTLRNEKERAIFRIQEGICAGAREYLSGEDFTEIHSPKIVSEGAEGGSDLFRLDYFGKSAYLAQSPQFYKQTMTGVYGRVFEIAPVYRAEPHDTSRHLNEYIGIDLEMGYIENFRDIMETETHMLVHIFSYLKERCADELSLWNAALPELPPEPPACESSVSDRLTWSGSIPCITFVQAKALAAEGGTDTAASPEDLSPEEERLIGAWIKKNTGSDFVFVTHYPSSKRPFYAMDDPGCPERTLSFDLLFHGLEITTGGQRIHSHAEQIRKMKARGMDPELFSSYLMIHRCGMPPHGGLGIGLERLTSGLLGFTNVRRASLFPRDSVRLSP